MRTTLTLDRDAAERIRGEMRRTGKAVKTIVNDGLRLGLRVGARPPRAPRFEVQPHDFGFKPGIDQDRLNQLVDEIEASEAGRRLTR